MPPKKSTAAASATKKAAPTHASYRDMIKDAILNLKERNGSSRQSIKKYVLANNNIAVTSQAAFDSQFNKAIKAGVEKKEFEQPKGPSGPVKLAKKQAAAKPAAAKPAAKGTTKATTAKKPAAKKTEKAAPKAATTKKAGTTKKTTAKANTARPRKTSTAAPAVVDHPKVLGKTKSGRVTKSTAKPAEKKTTTKRKAAPKKAEASA